jgi:2-keto-4-pentenoate hydratase/2-oxohepta-3-ene-1,7-dioic acid hydratase in catechol pathway
LAIVLGKQAKCVTVAEALDCVEVYIEGIGILTNTAA